jgi:hypothetical protein
VAQVTIPADARPGSTIRVAVPGPDAQPGAAAFDNAGGVDDEGLAAAIRASLQDQQASAAPDPFAASSVNTQHAAPANQGGDSVQQATREAIQMGFPRDQVERAQASHKFTSTDVLVEHLVSGGGGSAAPARAPAPAPAPATASPQQRVSEDAQLAAAIQASLNEVRQAPGQPSAAAARGGGRGGAAMDPAHRMRSLVITTLQGDPAARSDLKQELDDLVSRRKSPTDRLVYFLLENCKMEKLSKLPEDIIPLWMSFLGKAPPQPQLKNLIVIEGQLSKQGSKKWDVKGWKQKWFVLTDGMLCYYNKLQDKMKGDAPKNKIPLSSVIRLQTVPSSTSGMECSFEFITEGDLPNWKVHACISDNMGESQMYWSSWQSAVEDAVRGAHDLEKGFLNAKPQHYWHELDEQMESPVASRSPAASRSSRGHHRQESNDSVGSGDDAFNPRAFTGGISDDPFAASSSSSSAAAAADPFGVPAPAPAPAAPIDIIGDLLGGDSMAPAQGRFLSQIATGAADPFSAVLFGSPPPAPAMSAPPPYMASATPISTPPNPAWQHPVMTPSPAPGGPAPGMMPSAFPMAPMPATAAPNPFRMDQQPPSGGNPFGAGQHPAMGARMGGQLQPQVLGSARGLDGALSPSLFDAPAQSVAQAAVGNPFRNANAAPGLSVAAPPGAQRSVPNPFASLQVRPSLRQKGVRLSLLHPLLHTRFDWY